MVILMYVTHQMYDVWCWRS